MTNDLIQSTPHEGSFNAARFWVEEGQLDDYLKAGGDNQAPVAYFCAEFGLHESLQQYSGGLGILAGDHCKEASDMNLPFVAVGCFYRLGFFRQSLDPNGRQEHIYVKQTPETSPAERVVVGGQPLTVEIPAPGRSIKVAVWRLATGRIPLILLDTDHPDNSEADRRITSQLYTRGREMRFYQELVLGVAGVRALKALGIEPKTYHLNEGHSVLLVVERLRDLMASGKTADQAKAEVKAHTILTIHTPVTAGNEQFDAKLVKRQLSPLLEGSGISIDAVLKLGRGEDGDPKVFDMTAYALRHSRQANGVSLLHGETANATWLPVVGMPVQGLTNGVHMPTWLGPEMKALFAKNGARLAGDTDLELTERKGKRALWAGASKIDSKELWQAHLAQKKRLAGYLSRKFLDYAVRTGASPEGIDSVSHSFNPNVFTIGFARRFATYKRASLIFSNPSRISALLKSTDRPVQIVFAGKAHPADSEGQALIAEVAKFASNPKFAGKVFLVEDYDMEVGRMLTQGVDLWLNNPRRPLEASGTSGMKAAANGVPNASILDGWWDEAFEAEPRNGFAIGGREASKNVKAQDKQDALELYRVLEEEVIPLYYKLDKDGLPKEWIEVMRNSIATSVWAFSTRRMLQDYVQTMYG